MNEVKKICAVLLDEAEPPLRAGEDVFALARRDTRRQTARRLVQTGVGGAGLAGLVAAALLAPGVFAGPAGTSESNTAVVPGSTGPTADQPSMVAAAQRTLPDLPTAKEVMANGDAIFSVLSDAVPRGYRTERRLGGSDGPSVWLLQSAADWRHRTGTLSYVALAALSVRAGGREGGLAAYIFGDRRPTPTGDLCAPGVSARTDQLIGPATSCQVIKVGGVPIRVTRYHDPEQGEIVNATWFVRNGFVTVSSQQGLPRELPQGESGTELPPDAKQPLGPVAPHRPPLKHPLFTAEQLARIAANPALLP